MLLLWRVPGVDPLVHGGRVLLAERLAAEPAEEWFDAAMHPLVDQQLTTAPAALATCNVQGVGEGEMRDTESKNVGKGEK